MGHEPYYGLLINAAISFLVFVSSWYLGIKVIKRKAIGKAKIPAMAFAVVWLDIGLIYLSVAIRTLFAYFGMEQLDKMFFYADNFFGAMLGPSIIFFTFYLMFKNKKVADMIAILWVIIGFVWWIFDVKIGAVREGAVTYWLSEWKPGDERLMIAFGLLFFLPGLIALIALMLTSRNAPRRTTKYKINMTALSLIVGATLMLIDLGGTSPIMGIVVRVLIALVTVLGHLAYFPTEKIEKWLERG